MTFDPHAPGYDAGNALTLARLSARSYDSREELRPRSGQFQTARFFDVAGTTALLIANDEAAIVAFRGTETDALEDWLTDARIRFTPFPGGRVHVGFHAALAEVDAAILAALAEPAVRDLPLWVTGHSLGGALAVLLAARLLTDGRAIRGLYTFGQPRVGDGDFAAHYEPALAGRYFRFLNGNDPVPRLPPWLLGYRSLGSELLFDTDGRIVTVPSLRAAFDQAAETFQTHWSAGDLQALASHGIERYIERLGDNLDFRLDP